MGDDAGHLRWIESADASESRLHITVRGHKDVVAPRIWEPSTQSRQNNHRRCNRMLRILTFMNDRFEKSDDDLEWCLPFQMRPNFGAICLSILSRLPHEMIVSSTGAFPVPNGFGTGRMGGIEWVDGACTRCN